MEMSSPSEREIYPAGSERPISERPTTTSRRKRAAGKRHVPSPAQLEAVLRGGRICLLLQDTSLRYSWVSGPLCDIPPADILNRTDEELSAKFEHEEAIAAKRHVLETGEPADAEFSRQVDGRRSFFSLHIEPAFAPDGPIQGVICAALEITERKERERQLYLLLREITHRSKNLLAVIQGMARQTAHYSGSIGAFLDRFGARLQALSQSHDLLVQQSWHSASLRDLMYGQLVPYVEGGSLTIEGPGIWLTPEAAQMVGLAIHELAANAVKYGSLSRPKGKVAVVWRRLPDDGVEISWTESGGPEVKPVRDSGFGRVVLEKTLPRALNAKVALDFNSSGLRCRITVPAAHLIRADRPEHRVAAAR
jgi:two-component sensor histidine kinase